MNAIHEYVGWTIPVGFGLLALWAAASLVRNRPPGGGFWTLLGILQVVIGVQVVVGVILLLLGGVPPAAPAWLHYAYGGLFPAALLIAAHRIGARYADIPWVIFGIASLVICGLTVRALMTGLGA